MAEEGSCATQLINGEGEFNIAGLEAFTRTVKLSELGVSYAVVAIIGPQSSGKSTLLNHLFHTSFVEMDAIKGRSQTTKGIWIARAVGIAPCTVIMDVEGSDGKERVKKDETAFEKQSALFALAVSDVVLINMWCNDIGRNEAANRPLLKTVFQAMPRLCSPRKTTLLFVIRDKTKTPLASLEASLREDMQQIWDTVQKPQAFKDTPLSDFFNVEVTALSSYELQEDQFNEQVGQLRQQFFNSIALGGVAGDRRGVVPASGFSNWAEKIWKDIKENRDLDLPAHRVMLASVRCDEIGSVQLTRLTSDESWLSLEEAVQAGPVPGFVQRLSSILETYLKEYDTMTLYYDENVRKTKRQVFESKTLQLVHPAYVIFLQHLRSETLKSFKTSLEQTLHKGEEFDSLVGKYTQACMKKFDFSCAGDSGQQTYWDASNVREELLRDIQAHASAVRSAKLVEIVTGYEKLLDEALIAPVESLFNTIGEHTWASIRKLLKRETDAAVARFSSAISGFELDHSTRDSMVQNLQTYARSVVEKKSRDEAAKVLTRMKERFSTVFDYDNWTGKEDIQAIKKAAWSASLEVLAVMAVICLDEKPDEVEKILFSSLMDGTETTDFLASSSWEKVPPEATLITPLRCKSLWRKFKEETEVAVTKAVSAQVMLASVRCDEIGSVQLTHLTSDESWLSLEESVQAGPVPGFVQRLSSILETYLSEYDTMTRYYDENVRKTRRQEFESKVLQQVHPAYVIFLQHLRSETLESFKTSFEQTLHKGEEFDSSVDKYTQACMKKFDFSCAGNSGQQTYWDASKVRGELLRDILAEIVTGYEKLLDEALIAPVESLFNTVGKDTWASIRKLLKRETDTAGARFSSAISGFELDRDSMVRNLQNYARSVVEKKSKDEAAKVLTRMKERFSKVFEYDNVRRVWNEKEDIGEIRKAAWSASLKVLAVMAVMRLNGKPDEVEDILFSSLMDGTATTDILASSSWEKVPAVATLITPLRCKSIWREFKAETVDAVKQAVSAQEDHMQRFANAHRSSRLLGCVAGVAAGAATVAATAAATAAAGAAVAAAGAAGAAAGVVASAVGVADSGLLMSVASGVVAGAAPAVKACMAVKDDVAAALGAPDLENFAMIRRRNRDMLAESD